MQSRGPSHENRVDVVPPIFVVVMIPEVVPRLSEPGLQEIYSLEVCVTIFDLDYYNLWPPMLYTESPKDFQLEAFHVDNEKLKCRVDFHCLQEIVQCPHWNAINHG